MIKASRRLDIQSSRWLNVLLAVYNRADGITGRLERAVGIAPLPVYEVVEYVVAGPPEADEAISIRFAVCHFARITGGDCRPDPARTNVARTGISIYLDRD